MKVFEVKGWNIFHVIQMVEEHNDSVNFKGLNVWVFLLNFGGRELFEQEIKKMVILKFVKVT